MDTGDKLTYYEGESTFSLTYESIVAEAGTGSEDGEPSKY